MVREWKLRVMFLSNVERNDSSFSPYWVSPSALILFLFLSHSVSAFNYSLHFSITVDSQHVSNFFFKILTFLSACSFLFSVLLLFLSLSVSASHYSLHFSVSLELQLSAFFFQIVTCLFVCSFPFSALFISLSQSCSFLFLRPLSASMKLSLNYQWFILFFILISLHLLCFEVRDPLVLKFVWWSFKALGLLNFIIHSYYYYSLHQLF